MNRVEVVTVLAALENIADANGRRRASILGAISGLRAARYFKTRFGISVAARPRSSGDRATAF